MAWQTPKIDWAVHYDTIGNYTGDYFNAADYSRIKGNLEWLRTMATTVVPEPVVFEIPTVTVASYGYASTFNALERELDNLLTAGVFNPGIAGRKTWTGNQTAPLAADFNRIENSCLQLYNVLTHQISARQQLAFKLGFGGFLNGT